LLRVFGFAGGFAVAVAGLVAVAFGAAVVVTGLAEVLFEPPVVVAAGVVDEVAGAAGNAVSGVGTGGTGVFMTPAISWSKPSTVLL